MLSALASFCQDLIIKAGYPGVIFVAALENFFPPLPSELIFPFVGFIVAQGKLSFAWVVAAGVLGTFAGALFWYWAGYVLGAEKLKGLISHWGKAMGIKLRDIERAEQWFERYEAPVVFFGRLIPLVRTFISVPAGFVKMKLVPFSLLTLVGSTLWIGLLTYSGFVLGENWGAVVPYIKNYELAIEVFIAVAVVVFLVVKLRKPRKT